MRFNYNNKTYAIEFQRVYRRVHVRDKRTKNVKYVQIAQYPNTIVKLVEVEKGEDPKFWKVFATAEVGCFKTDQFTKEAGRLAAMRKLSPELDVGMRQAMWQRYVGRKG